jgi:thioredoxin reductase (NADPH)
MAADRQTPPISDARRALMFPTLTDAQVARIALHGKVRQAGRGAVLIEAGDAEVPFFVVRTGEIEIFQPGTETLVATHGPGQFTGEGNLLLGRRSLMRAVVSQPGEFVQLTRAELLGLVQTDAEISEILMRAFMYRRVELIAQGLGDVMLIGSTHSAGTLRLREFLARNGHPFHYIDLDHDQDVQQLLDRFNVHPGDVPVLIGCGGAVLRNPANQEVADALGFNENIDATHVRDMVVVGAGPAGLAAAVYGASEGLDVLVIEAKRSGRSGGLELTHRKLSRISHGISGQDLAGRALAQAQKFGADLMVSRGATSMACDRQPYTIAVGDGPGIQTRTIVIATGVQYRRPDIASLSQFEGAGVYYSATFMEAQLCNDHEVVVVGGGNSAGQAAVFLAQTSKHVHVLVRGEALKDTMSRYLIRRIEENPAISLRPHTEIVALEGNGQLERVSWRDKSTGGLETRDIRHVFLMTGAVPNTAWLDGCIALDPKGFVKTGAELKDADLAAAKWPLARAPHLLETSRPGVFAVGDVRCGSIKRVASAVGEGSIAVSFVHQALGE